MALNYYLYQDTRSNGNNKWYARSVHPVTVEIDQLAEEVEHNCSMTKGDVLAILQELCVQLKYILQEGNKVKLDNFGIFYYTITTIGAKSEEEFTPVDNIKSINPRFFAARKKSNRKYNILFTDGVKFKKVDAPKKTVSPGP